MHTDSHLSEMHPHLVEFKRNEHHHKAGRHRPRRSVLIIHHNRREATTLARDIFRFWHPRRPDPTRVHSTPHLVHIHTTGRSASPSLFVSALHKLTEPELEHLYTTFELKCHTIVAVSDSGMHELAPAFDHTINTLKQPELPIPLQGRQHNPRLEQHDRHWEHFSKLGSAEHLAKLLSTTSNKPDLVGMKMVYQFLINSFPDIMRPYSYEDVRKWDIPPVVNPGHSCRKHYSSQRVMEYIVMRFSQ